MNDLLTIETLAPLNLCPPIPNSLQSSSSSIPNSLQSSSSVFSLFVVGASHFHSPFHRPSQHSHPCSFYQDLLNLSQCPDLLPYIEQVWWHIYIYWVSRFSWHFSPLSPKYFHLCYIASCVSTLGNVCSWNLTCWSHGMNLNDRIWDICSEWWINVYTFEFRLTAFIRYIYCLINTDKQSIKTWSLRTYTKHNSDVEVKTLLCVCYESSHWNIIFLLTDFLLTSSSWAEHHWQWYYSSVKLRGHFHWTRIYKPMET